MACASPLLRLLFDGKKKERWKKEGVGGKEESASAERASSGKGVAGGDDKAIGRASKASPPTTSPDHRPTRRDERRETGEGEGRGR